MDLTRRQMLATTAAALVAPVASSARAPANPADYPELDALQLGHLRHVANLAGQRDNDWSNMDAEEPGQGHFDAYRYQLAMMSYALNLATYHYTPAYREESRLVAERLIEKMLRFDVWSFWEQVSRGAKTFDPSLTQLSEGWRDPVVRQNIMYSGHLFQMVATHAMLYDSDRYARPGALTFVHNPVGRGLGPEEFRYDAARLAGVLRDQFEANGYAGIECEPNAIFVECNQHPILGFKLFDARYGTGHFAEVSQRYLKAYDDLRFLNPDNGSIMLFRMVKQGARVPAEMAWNDGWAGIFMHGWAPDKVHAVYPQLRRKYVVAQRDGTAVIPFKKASTYWSWDNGFFAALAAEVGDVDTARAMLAYADRHWSPTWTRGGLHYPRNDRYEPENGAGNGSPDAFTSPRVNILTGNALLTLARINPGQGLQRMVANPWTAEHFRQPHLISKGDPQVEVSRAVFDPQKQALVLRLRRSPGASGVAAATLTFGGLNVRQAYALSAGPVTAARIEAGSAGTSAAGTRYQREGALLVADIPVTGTTDLVLQAV